MWRGQEESLTWVEEFLNLMEKWQTISWAEEKGQIIKSMRPIIYKRKRERKIYGAELGFASQADKHAQGKGHTSPHGDGDAVFPPQCALY